MSEELYFKNSQKPQKMPDVSHESQAVETYALEQVGMSDIEMPVNVSVGGTLSKVPAKIDAFVSLDDPAAKGIHMSRLYLGLKEILEENELSLKTMKNILSRFVDSQKGLSSCSYLRVKFLLPAERPALLSEQKGWRQYPMTLSASLEKGNYKFNMGGEISYSSTCPCSAALSRQLLQEKFLQDYKGEESLAFDDILSWLGKESSQVATPHAQRSIAEFDICLDPESIAPDPITVIDMLERSIGTPVQAAVKRQDEQEFARLNAENLMFCEDAARKLKAVLESENRFLDYKVRVEHIESLHPHSATSSFVKGVEGGFHV